MVSVSLSKQVLSIAAFSLSISFGAQVVHARDINALTLEYLKDAAVKVRDESERKAHTFKESLDTGVYATDALSSAFGLGAYYLGKRECKVALQYLSVAETLAGHQHELSPFLTLHKAIATHECGDYEASLTMARQLEAHSKALGHNIEVLRIHLVFSNLESMGNNPGIINYYARVRPKLAPSSTTAAAESYGIIVKAYLATSNDWDKIYELLERVASPYPTTEMARWAYSELNKFSEKSENHRPAYVYSTNLLRLFARNTTLDASIGPWVLRQLDKPVRVATVVKKLGLTDKLEFLITCRMYKETSVIADEALATNAYPKHEKPRLLLQAARAATETNSDLKALDYYQRYTNEFSPTYVPPKVREMMAFAYNRLGDFQRASSNFREIAARNNVNTNVNLRWHQFWNLYRAKDWAGALALLDTSKYVTPQDSNEPNAIYYWRAKVLEKLDHLGAAKQDYMALLKKDGSSFYSVLVQNLYPNLIDDVAPEEKPVLTASLSTLPELDRRSPYMPEPRRDLSSDYPLMYDEVLTPLCEKIGIDKYLILAIMRSESLYNTYATSPVGAKGLLQLMPYTAIKIADLIGYKEFDIHDLESPETNIVFGTFYLGFLLKQFDNPMIAVAAYNAGPVAVNQWLGRCQGCSIDEFVESIPYRETRRYVKGVFRHFSEYTRKYNSNSQLPVGWETPAPLVDAEHLF